MNSSVLYIISDSATQLLAKQLQKIFDKQELNIKVIEAPYHQAERLIFNTGSELYALKPEYVLLFLTTHKLFDAFVNLSADEKVDFAATQLQYIESVMVKLGDLNSKLLLCNFYEIGEPVFGNFANKAPQSFLCQLRKLNVGLMDLVVNNPHCFIIDVASVVNRLGFANALDSRMLTLADMPLHLDAQHSMALNIMQVIKAQKGYLAKCLILDLDNTLWGGVVADDGVENLQIGHLGVGKAFTALQKYAKLLKDRGIILVVCSKNSEANAKLPFVEHPDMVLRLDDIAVFVANFNNKADNIRHIQQILNIGFDAMVFIDDNPFERDFVHKELPDVVVPDLPDDPANYVPFLMGLNLFETVSFTHSDTNRTLQYQAEARRITERQNFSDEAGYLQSLNMVATVKPFDAFSIPRVAQLSQRSNQFNLRTIRYTEADILSLSRNPNYITLSIDLADKHGSHGLIAAIILKKSGRSLFVDTWIMSCRVLNRGVEQFTLNQMVQLAQNEDVDYITAEYLETPKNGLVKNLLPNLGFVFQNDVWTLPLLPYKPKYTFIHINPRTNE